MPTYLHGCQVVLLCRPEDGRLVILVHGIKVCALLKQCFHGLRVTITRGDQQRTEVILVKLVNLCTSATQIKLVCTREGLVARSIELSLVSYL